MLCRYLGKGEGYARVAIKEALAKEAQQAAAEGRERRKLDVMKLFSTRKVTTASEAYARVLEAAIATWFPSVEPIRVAMPSQRAVRLASTCSS